MIDIRPLNPVREVGDGDTRIGRFTDSEWRGLIELVRRYGFEPPEGDQAYHPQAFDQPIEIEPETSQRLWEAVSAVYNDDAVPSGVSYAFGRAGVTRLLGCAQIGAEHGGIEIRRAREED